MTSEAQRIEIEAERDVRLAVRTAVDAARSLGFDRTRSLMIGTAVSELARNIHVHACQGYISIETSRRGEAIGLRIVAQDDGPGIEDLDLALQDHYSTRRSLGIGLPGTKRLMDEFDISSEPGKGTCISVSKWK